MADTTQLSGASIELFENSLDAPVYPDKTIFYGFAIEFLQNANDIVFNDVTVLNGFAMELLDYPFYSFAITETR